MPKTTRFLHRVCLAAGGLLAASSSLHGQAPDVGSIYQNNCASCHDGGQGSSLRDGIWNHGSSDKEIAANIRNGIADTTMVAWGSAFDEEQIRSLVIYLREQERAFARDSQPAPQTAGVYQSQKYDFQLEKVAEGTGILWALDFLPDGSMLVTQRDGTLWHFQDGERHEITGIPEVWQNGQGGLLEVQLHPNYAENGWVYLGYSESTGAKDGGRVAGMTAVVRGRIQDGKWVDQESIYHAAPSLHLSPGAHFGTRFVFQDGYLFFGIGDRGRRDLAQDLSRPNGKIHRVYDDGRIPDDNPFRNDTNALPTIWSYGHRNPQGLDAHPETGGLWEVEHGPRGGDEVNLVQGGLNYGWPVITYGMNYNGTPITSLTEKEGMQQPKHYWVPSIAICGVDFYEGDVFPAWKNNLFVSGMASQELHRLVIEGDEVVADEIVLSGAGRIRDVHSGPDGLLYLLLIDPNSRIGSVYRLTPSQN